jgi:hypothetical protein
MSASTPAPSGVQEEYEHKLAELEEEKGNLQLKLVEMEEVLGAKGDNYGIFIITVCVLTHLAKNWENK